MMFSTIIGFPYKMAWPVTRYNPSQCSNGIGNKMNMWRIGTDKRKKIFSKIYRLKGLEPIIKQRPHVLTFRNVVILSKSTSTYL